jgi:hypothetical protein
MLTSLRRGREWDLEFPFCSPRQLLPDHCIAFERIFSFLASPFWRSSFFCEIKAYTMVGKRSLPQRRYEKDFKEDHRDEESGPPPRPRPSRFRDLANLALEDQRMRELKKLIKDGIEADNWESFRKSDEEVRITLVFSTVPC